MNDAEFQARMAEMDAWQATRWMRLLDWIEARMTRERSWPWGAIWLWRGFSFHFASGSCGFALTVPLPRWLPGYVHSYQTDGPRRFWQVCPWWRESDLHATLPLYPPGRPSAYRTRRLRRKSANSHSEADA